MYAKQWPPSFVPAAKGSARTPLGPKLYNRKLTFVEMESEMGLYQVCFEQLEVQQTGFSQTVLLPIKNFIPTHILNTKTTLYDLSQDIKPRTFNFKIENESSVDIMDI